MDSLIANDMFMSCERFTYGKDAKPVTENIPDDSLVVTKTKKFRGSTIFVDENNYRSELPIKKPDEPFPIWKIIKQFIGKDLTKVSMPVIMNEPLSGL